MLETISNFFGWLYTTITGFFGWLLSLFTDLILAFLMMLKDLSVWLFDMLMGLAVAALNAVSFPLNFLDFSGYFSVIPAEAINMLGVLGIHTAFSIIMTAYGIRLVLRMIPYLGSMFK